MAANVNDSKGENEEARITVLQKEEELKAMTEPILQLENRIESLETKEGFLLQKNEKMLQQSCSTMCHQRAEKGTLMTSVPNKFIAIAMQVEDGTRIWSGEEVSQA